MFICMQKINFISNFLKNHSINLQETFLMLICIQKINFIIHFFLKILQNSKLVILSNLGMPGHTHLKWLYHFEEAFDVYLRQKINFILHVFLLRYCKDIANFLFLVFLVCLITHTQNGSINLQKLLCLSQCQKQTSSFIYILKNPAIWLVKNILTITWEPEFCKIWDWWWNIKNNISFHFRLFPGKNNDKIFQKIWKTLFWSHFWSFLPKFGKKWILIEKRALSVFKYYNHLPSCKKSEKNNNPFLRKILKWRTERQKDRETDRQTTVIL